jgi:hypothetical protein
LAVDQVLERFDLRGRGACIGHLRRWIGHRDVAFL